MTPEERALEIIDETPDAPKRAHLDSKECGIEWHEWPFVHNATLCMSHAVQGAFKAETVDDGNGRKQIEVEFPRTVHLDYLIPQMQQEQPHQAKLTNADINRSFSSMEHFLKKCHEKKLFVKSVSVRLWFD